MWRRLRREIAPLPTHDPKGDLAGTRPHFDIGLERFPASEGQPPTFGIKVRASSVDEDSVNAPHHFVIEAYAIVAMDGSIGDEAADRAAANLVGMQVVVAANRYTMPFASFSDVL